MPNDDEGTGINEELIKLIKQEGLPAVLDRMSRLEFDFSLQEPRAKQITGKVSIVFQGNDN